MPSKKNLRAPSVQETLLATHDELLNELRALRSEFFEMQSALRSIEIPAPVVQVEPTPIQVSPPKVSIPKQEGPERIIAALANVEHAINELHIAREELPNASLGNQDILASLKLIHEELRTLGSASGKQTGSKLIRGGGSNILGFVSTGAPTYTDQTNQKLSLTTDGGLRVSSSEQQYATRIDEASSTVTYIGDALPGSGTGSAVWRIKRMDTTSGTIITWADGNSNFDNIWDSRASLAYS